MTLGSHPKSKGLPKVGENVIIYTGSIVCGDLYIGDNAIIGANSYVDKDVHSYGFTRNSKTEIRKIEKYNE